MDPPLPALAPRGVPDQGILWTCSWGQGTAGLGVRRATVGGRDITTLSFSAWGDGRDTYLSGWLKMASTMILSMPFVTQSRLESKPSMVQRTGLSCFLCKKGSTFLGGTISHSGSSCPEVFGGLAWPIIQALIKLPAYAVLWAGTQ